MISIGHIIPCQEFDTARQKLFLNGAWSFSYDPHDIGEKEKWFSPDAHLPEKTFVLGCPQGKKHLSDGKAAASAAPGDIYHRYPCTAPAWYAKTFTVPADWKEKDIWLHIGGLHPAAMIWCNGKLVGHTRSSRTPLRCNLTQYLFCGKKNTLAFKLYWPQGSRLDGLFDWALPWTGIYRGIWLETVGKKYFKDIFIQSRIDPPSALIEITLQGKPAETLLISHDIRIEGQKSRYANTTKTGKNEKITLTIPMPGARLWSPKEPNLYEAILTLSDGNAILDKATVRFGLREIKTKDTTVYLNKKPIFLRGACDDQLYIETVCPPASKAFFKKRIQSAMKYGFNYTKSCEEIYTKEFLDVADECGYLVCQEMPSGLSTYGAMRHNPSCEHAAFLKQELQNIIVSDRNHPSVIIYSMTSELYLNKVPKKPCQNKRSFMLFCKELPKLTRLLNPTALVCDITHNTTTIIYTRFGKRDTDILENCCEGTNCPLTGPIKGLDNVKRPFLLHEYNWWTCLPDPDLLKRYRKKNIAFKPTAIPEMLQQAGKNGLVSQLPLFVKNSRKLKYTLRKDGLELARKHPKIAGYHHWLIHDFCWAPEGVFNEFWEEPKDLSAQEFKTYNDDTVLLLEDHNTRAVEWGQPLRFSLMLSHFGQEVLKNAELSWCIQNGKKIIINGKKKCKHIVPGSIAVLSNVNVRLPVSTRASQLELRAELWTQGKRIFWNHWPLWAYPTLREIECRAPIATDVPCVMSAWPRATKLMHPLGNPNPSCIVTNRLSHELIRFLANGGRVLLFARGILEGNHSSSSRCYRTVPWNGGKEGNMGTVMRAHPAFGDMPHKGWCDLNFAHLINGVYPIELEPFRPVRINPIIRSIGHQATMRDKAYLFEIGIGKGALLVSSLGIETWYEKDLTARYLLRQLLKYVVSERFVPEIHMSKIAFIRTLNKSGVILPKILTDHELLEE